MAKKLLTADTSVVIPFLSEWHDAHRSARAALRDVTRLPGHVLVESVSTLTRMPHGFALSPAVAVESVTRAFSGEPIVLDSRQHLSMLSGLGASRIAGGAVYDALVATIAMVAGATLITRDRRAERTYVALGTDYELLD